MKAMLFDRSMLAKVTSRTLSPSPAQDVPCSAEESASCPRRLGPTHAIGCHSCSRTLRLLLRLGEACPRTCRSQGLSGLQLCFTVRLCKKTANKKHSNHKNDPILTAAEDTHSATWRDACKGLMSQPTTMCTRALCVHMAPCLPPHVRSAGRAASPVGGAHAGLTASRWQYSAQAFCCSSLVGPCGDTLRCPERHALGTGTM